MMSSKTILGALALAALGVTVPACSGGKADGKGDSHEVSSALAENCGAEYADGQATYVGTSLTVVDDPTCDPNTVAVTIYQPVAKDCTNSNTGAACTITWTEVYTQNFVGPQDYYLGECGINGTSTWVGNQDVDDSSCDAVAQAPSSGGGGSNQPWYCSYYPEYDYLWPECN